MHSEIFEDFYLVKIYFFLFFKGNVYVTQSRRKSWILHFFFFLLIFVNENEW